MKPLHLLGDAIHLGASSSASGIPGFDSQYEAYIAKYCSKDDPGRLISIFESLMSWPVWERHPAGDEVVVILSGRARFFQELPEGIEATEVGPHEAIINPAGVYHTADVIEPFVALYITPGPGTEHRPR